MAPKWRELADRLAEQIKNGEIAPGKQLPHIRDQVEAGEGSKATVHAAYKALEAEGLVTSSRGHGTVVRPQTPLKRLSIERYDKAKWRDGDEVAFIADRVASGRSYRRGEQTQTVSFVEAPAVVAEAHGLPTGAQVYARARLVKEGEQPTHTLTSYYRPEHVEGTRIVDPTPALLVAGAATACSTTRVTRSITCGKSCSPARRRWRRQSSSSSPVANPSWSSIGRRTQRMARWSSSPLACTPRPASRGRTTSRCPTAPTTRRPRKEAPVPSEGTPQPIDTAVITTPSDAPTTNLWLLADRRERHTARATGQETSGASATDVLATLALDTVIRRVLDDQEQRLVFEGLRRGATWEQLAGALGATDLTQVQATFMTWAEQLPDDEATEALRLVGEGKGK